MLPKVAKTETVAAEVDGVAVTAEWAEAEVEGAHAEVSTIADLTTEVLFPTLLLPAIFVILEVYHLCYKLSRTVHSNYGPSACVLQQNKGFLKPSQKCVALQQVLTEKFLFKFKKNA